MTSSGRRPRWPVLAALGALLALTGCRIARVQDPSATVAYSMRGDQHGVRVGGGWELDRSNGLLGVGAAGHVGYDSVGNTPVLWGEAHVTFGFLSAFGGLTAERDGVGPAYGLALTWILATCDPPEPGENDGLFGPRDCEQRRRFVPRAFYRVETALDSEDRRLFGVEVVAGWW